MSERSDLDALQDLQTRFREFTNACSHDLRSPARNIGALCELLGELGTGSVLAESHASLLGIIIDESSRLTQILDGIVEYARVPLTAGRLPVDLAHLVRAFWMQDEADLTIDDIPPILGDRTLLARLVQELVSNAVRFSGGHPPKLHVFATQVGGFVDVHFADSGDGIQEGREQAAFAVLRRGHPNGGVGMGLAICERIVAAHDGSLRVVPGRTDGATIVVRLPINRDST